MPLGWLPLDPTGHVQLTPVETQAGAERLSQAPHSLLAAAVIRSSVAVRAMRTC